MKTPQQVLPYLILTFKSMCSTIHKGGYAISTKAKALRLHSCSKSNVDKKFFLWKNVPRGLKGSFPTFSYFVLCYFLTKQVTYRNYELIKGSISKKLCTILSKFSIIDIWWSRKWSLLSLAENTKQTIQLEINDNKHSNIWSPSTYIYLFLFFF